MAPQPPELFSISEKGAQELSHPVRSAPQPPSPPPLHIFPSQLSYSQKVTVQEGVTVCWAIPACPLHAQDVFMEITVYSSQSWASFSRSLLWKILCSLSFVSQGAIRIQTNSLPREKYKEGRG